MTDQEATKSPRETIMLVHKLVQESFGRRFHADWIPDGDSFFRFRHEPSLGLIGRAGFWPIPFLIYNIEMAGGFVNLPYQKGMKDGSVIYVRPDYRKQVEHYAALYQKATDKPVTIQVGPSEDNLETYVLDS